MNVRADLNDWPVNLAVTFLGAALVVTHDTPEYPRLVPIRVVDFFRGRG